MLRSCKGYKQFYIKQYVYALQVVIRNEKYGVKSVSKSKCYDYEYLSINEYAIANAGIEKLRLQHKKLTSMHIK